MRPTDADLAAFMKLAYERAEHKRLHTFSMWEVGEQLNWDRNKTIDVFERLHDRGYFEHAAIGGVQCLSAEGIEYCESVFGADPGVPEKRQLFLQAVYDRSEGSTTKFVDMNEVGTELGFEPGETEQMYWFWSSRMMLEAYSGGTVTLTPYAVEVIEGGSGQQAEAPTQLPPDVEPRTGLAHTTERRWAFCSVDLSRHSELLRQAGPQMASIMPKYRGLVNVEVEKRLGFIGSWAGDGGLAFFNGDGCEARAVEAALSILAGVVRLRPSDWPAERQLRVRIAVGTTFLTMPDEPHGLTNGVVNSVCHLQQSGVADTGLSVTQDVYDRLDGAVAAKFSQREGLFEGMAVHDLSGQDALHPN